MLLLIDSGSTHTFVNRAFVERANCQIDSAPTVHVRVANGQMLSSDAQVKGLQWWTRGATFTTDMRVLDFGAYDVILGIDWLQQFSPMLCHSGLKTISFDNLGRNITLQGVLPKQQNSLTELSVEQLTRWISGNEVWALAMVDSVNGTNITDAEPVPRDVQQLLDGFTNIFTAHVALPPQ